MADERSVVWILGAGFSRSLGGPLLSTFFKQHRMADLRMHYPAAKYKRMSGPFIDSVTTIYAAGVKGELWSDPEAFLDYLDLAHLLAPDTPWRHSPALLSEAQKASQNLPVPVLRILALLEKNISQAVLQPERLGSITIKLHAAARRLMAAECMVFLEGQSVELEKWQPCWDWLHLVGPQDWILSFNYDLVVETLLITSTRRLGSQGKKHFAKEPMVVLEPGDEASSFPEQAKMLKLHGSVDWKKTANGYVKSNDQHFALSCDDEEIGIASPGANKLLESSNGLKPLWSLAEDALKKADAIVLLGYRFPPSDAHARRTIVTAIATHPNPSQYIAGHVVLGSTSLDATRTHRILEYALQRADREDKPHGYTHGYRARVQPLSVEDFVTVMGRDHLWGR